MAVDVSCRQFDTSSGREVKYHVQFINGEVRNFFNTPFFALSATFLQVTTEECARLSVSCLCSLLNDSPENVAVFHSSDGHVILSRMVEVPGLARSLALQIYAHLIVTSDTGEDEMSSLLSKSYSCI